MKILNKLILVISLFILISFIVSAYDNTFTPEDVSDWSKVDQSQIPPNQVNTIPPENVNLNQLDSSQRQQLTQDQLFSIMSRDGTNSLGDLGNYNSASLSQALQSAGYEISNLHGNLNGAKFEGNSLVLPDESKYDAKSGQKIDLEVASDGTTKSFSNNNGISFFNAKGVNYNGLSLTIASADSVSWFGATSTKIIDFAGESGTFSVKSADRVIVETMTFDKIINSVFSVSNGNLLSAGIECAKNNSKTKFPNLISGTSNFITSNCDDSGKYSVAYRENANEIVFNLSENMSILFAGAYANITFNASRGASLIIKPNGAFAVKNGILSYITPTFTEQLEGNCGDYSLVDLDFSSGFLKLALMPFNNYQTGVFICPGARYNRIYAEKENSYSIYNIGKSAYYVVFSRNIQVFNGLFSANRDSGNYGFIAENITLNGNIEYDRYPEKGLFPAISQEEYSYLPLDFKKVYAGYDSKTRTSIAGESRIKIISKNANGTGDVNEEINSGYFNIEQIGNSRFANFNRNMTYPDYISDYSYNSEPLIKIESKKLIEIGGNRSTIMYAPNQEESNKFLDWLKIKLALNDLAEVISKVRGESKINVEVST